MKNNKKRNLLLSLILAAVCLAFLLYVDKFQHYSMLATVLKKGAIYSLVAVSLNLLNGFTGLFSLGQALFHARTRKHSIFLNKYYKSI